MNNQMENKNIEVDLKIIQEGNHLFCFITFKNIADIDQYLYKINSCYDNELLNDVFVIVSQNEKINYIGPRIKWPKPQKEDFELLVPGATIERKVQIDSCYDFNFSQSIYQIYYQAYHGSPDDTSFLKQIVSKKIEFSFVKK
jgi:hypothetical protein